MKSPEHFGKLISHFSSNGKPKAPLCNVSFLLGAGFSKSWDERFPTGDELFTIKYHEWCNSCRHLDSYLRTHGYDEIEDISPDLFKQLIYQLGMYKKYPSIRPRYIDDGNIEIVESEMRSLVHEKFKKTAPLYYFDEKKNKISIPGKLSQEQQIIIDFFSQLRREGDGSAGISEGVRPHIITTNYDNIPEAILDYDCGPDDSFLLYTYRGITPSIVCGTGNPEAVHDNWLVNCLFKVNGGFEVYQHNNYFELDYTKRSKASIRLNPPQLMLPSNEQDYTQTYFKALFPKTIRLLQESKILVIVGYSLPEEDVLIRFIAKQFAEDRADGDNKFIFYVDLSDEKEQERKILSIFPHAEYGRGLSYFTYSGNFSKWAKKALQFLSS